MRAHALLLLSIAVFGCQSKEEEDDPSEIERIVLLDESEENSLVQESAIPQEMILLEDRDPPAIR
jgi:hypothetical protein